MSPRVKHEGGIVPKPLVPIKYSPQEIYTTYIKWLTVPKRDRKPLTQEEFCSRMGCNAADLLDIQDMDTFTSDLTEEMLKWARRRTPEIIQNLYERFEKKEATTADLKAWLEVVHPERSPSPSGPSSQTTNNIINIFNPTDEQRRQIFERGAKRIASNGSGSEDGSTDL